MKHLCPFSGAFCYALLQFSRAYVDANVRSGLDVQLVAVILFPFFSRFIDQSSWVSIYLWLNWSHFQNEKRLGS
jgi:hypothetical protein